LALLGQLYFARRRDYLWDGVVLYGLAGLLFLGAIRLAGLAPAHAGAPGWPRRALAWAGAHRLRAAALGWSLLAALWVGARAAGRLSAAEGGLLLGLWLTAIAAYVAALSDWHAAHSWLRSLPSRLRAGPCDALALLGLSAVALATRLPGLGRIPFVLGGDEASMGLEAMAVLQGRLTNPFVTGWFSHPTLFFYMLAGALSRLGSTIAGLRALPALAGALTVPALYLLARDLFGRRVALLAAGYLACYHYAVHYSRLGLNNIMDPLVATVACYVLLAGLNNRRRELFALAGALLGLGQYLYTGARVLPIVVAAYLAWCAWREPGFWQANRGHLVLLVGGFVLAGWPLFLFFARQPQDFMARMTLTGVVQSGWLERTAAELGRSQLSLWLEQAQKTLLAFHYYADPAVFYHPGIPLMDFASAIPFTFGLVYGLVRRCERGHALMLLWLGAVLVCGGILLENPPSSQRLVLSAVPASVLVALGLCAMAEVAERALHWQRATTQTLLGLALIALAAINLSFYFVTYTPARVYAGYNTEVGHEIGLYLRSLGPGHRLYFFGAPRMYAGFPNAAYLAPNVEQRDVMEPLVGEPGFVEPDKRPVFVFLPERLGELPWIEGAYPAGRRYEGRQPTGTLLFVAYEPIE